MNSRLRSNPEDSQLEAQAGLKTHFSVKRPRAHFLLLYYDAFANVMLLKLKIHFIFSV